MTTAPRSQEFAPQPASAADAARDAVASRYGAVSKALGRLYDSKKAPKRDVHRLRVATRRAGAALAAFEPQIGSTVVKRAQKQLKLIRRAAGDARAADVHTDLLSSFSPSLSTLGREACSELIESSRARAKRARIGLRRLPKSVTPRDVQTWGSDVQRAIERTSRSKTGPFSLSGAVRVTLVNLKLDLESHSAVPIDTLEQLHELRITVKRIRYTSEVFKHCFSLGILEGIQNACVRLQEHLGLINDFGELAERASDHRDHARGRAENGKAKHIRTLEGFVELELRLQDERDRMRQRFLDEWTGGTGAELGRLLDAAIREQQSRAPSDESQIAGAGAP